MPRVSFTMSSTDHVGGRLFVLGERFNSVCLRTLSCGRATFLLSIIHLGICGRGRAPLSSPSSGLLALLLRPSLDVLGQIARIRQSKPPVVDTTANLDTNGPADSFLPGRAPRSVDP
jgi:hypothetical protein